MHQRARDESLRRGAVKALLIGFLAAALGCAAFSRTEAPEGAWRADTEGATARSLSYSATFDPLGTNTPALIVFHNNTARSENSIGTIGFDLEIARYNALQSFHFEDFEGPDAPSRKRSLMKATIHRSSKPPLSFEFSPAGFVSSIANSPNLVFHFTVVSPSIGASTVKQLMRALADDAQSLEISIADTRDPSMELKLSLPVADRREDFERLLQDASS